MIKSSKFVINFNKPEITDEEFLDPNFSALLSAKHIGLSIPDGFLITSRAYFDFLSSNHLSKKIADLVSTIHFERPDSLMQASGHISKILTASRLNEDLVTEITAEYKKWNGIFKTAEVIVGEKNKTIKNINQLIREVISIWASRFEAKRLLYYHLHHRNILEDGISIPVYKTVKSTKSGKLLTSTSEISTNAALSSSEFKKISELSSMLKKHFYIPQEVSWSIDKKDIYIVRLKPMTNAQQSSLVLIRHGQSEWNAKGLWTGWSDPSLSDLGVQQANEAGKQLTDIHFDLAYTSALLRAIQTLDHIKIAKKQTKIPTTSNKALNERDYGELTGKNKWEVEKEFGKEQFMKWRRGWDEPIPHGESLKDVYRRVIPYFEENILPQLKSGKNIIIAAHGNSLRALVKHLEKISDKDISHLEIPVGQIHVYKIDEDGNIVSKEIRNQKTEKE